MRDAFRRLFSFPDPVDETSARLVATGVVAQVAVFAVVREGWLLVPLVSGFAARVLTGPTLSPLGQFVTRVVSPRMPGRHRPVPGRPKRFAQGIGLVVSSGVALAWWLGSPTVALLLLALLALAAGLEAFGGVCLGCIAYRFVWECDDCDDISERLRVAMSARTTDAEPDPSVAAATR